MNNFWKKIGILGALAVVMTVPGVNDVGHADTLRDGKLNVGGCLQQGGLDFTLFMNSMIFVDGFYGDVIEPWGDVLWSNQCHALDLIALQDDRDAIRSQIRRSFLTCSTEELPSLRQAYYRIRAEIYYVRHSVDRKIVVNTPFNLLSTAPQMAYTDQDALFEEMKEKYVNKGEHFTEEEFEQFFRSLQIKYTERIEQYAVCDNTSWEDVVEKWEEFQEDFKGGFGAVESFEQVRERAGDVSNEAVDFWNTITTKEGLKAWMEGIVDISVNNLAPKEGFDQILATLKERDIIDGGSGLLEQDEAFEALSNADVIFDTEVLQATMSARFFAIYGQDSTNADEFVNELEKLNETIEGTYGAMDAIQNCSKTINKRQCPGG